MNTIEQRRLLYFAVVAIALMSIVCQTATAAAMASPTTTAPEMHVSHAHKNMAAYENGFTANRHYHASQQQRQATPSGDLLYYRHQYDDKTNSQQGVDTVDPLRRSYSNNNNNKNEHGNGMTGALVTLTASSSSSSSSPSSASGDGGPTTTNSNSRFYNGLTNLSGLRHISSNGNGNGQSTTAVAAAVAADALATSSSRAKQQIPIYEDQHEDEHTATGYAGENNQHTVNAFIPSAYHNNFIPLSNAAWESYQAKATTPYYHHQQQQQHDLEQQQQQQQQQHERQQRQFLQQSNDKISDGNFQHHYEHNSGYNGLNEHSPSYSTASSTSTSWHYPSSPSAAFSSGYSAYAPDAFDDGHSQSFASKHFPQYHPNHEQLENTGDAVDAGDISSHGNANDDDDDPAALPNYLAPHQPQEEVQHQTNVINYIPYPVVKKQHVPVRAPVQIPISHAVIVPVSKPVPIHIPVTQQVQVPVEKELKIPIERVVPFPVEKHVPVPVEKRVPYPVVRYVPIKVNRPFPVKVPVYKTILHKVKEGGWW